MKNPQGNHKEYSHMEKSYTKKEILDAIQSQQAENWVVEFMKAIFDSMEQVGSTVEFKEYSSNNQQIYNMTIAVEKIEEEGNTFTLAKLKEFLSTLDDEQLKQNVHIAFEDCPVQDLYGSEVVPEDIYVNVNDNDDVGTLKELKEIHEDEFVEDDYVLSTPKGYVAFY